MNIDRPDSQHQEEFMRRAISLALESIREGGGPFGAVIVRDGIIIAEGTNRVTGTNDPTAHAEIVAIREACATLGRFQLADCDIYTSCEPCPMCLGGIYWGRLRSVFYGNSRNDAAEAGFDDSRIYSQMALPPLERSIPMRQLIPAEALVAFRAWEAFDGKIRY